jgi:hypothetical protein
MLSPTQRHTVFDAIPCVLCGDAIPIMQVNDDIPNFCSSIPSWIVGTVITQGISSLYQGKGQLRRAWNPATSEYDIWDGEIFKATLNIDVRSVNKSKVFDYASALVWDIKEHLMNLSKTRDKVWVGPEEIMSVKDLGSYQDEDLNHKVHRVLIELQLEYEVSFKKIGYPILTIQNTMQLYPPDRKGIVAQDVYVMKAPRLLPAYMAIGLDIPLSLTAEMRIVE